MISKKIIIPLLVGTSLIAGGCSDMDKPDKKKESVNAGEKAPDKSAEYVSVQEYNGDGYMLEGGQKNGKIAEENKGEIAEQVEFFFKEKYKSEVTVRNIAGNKDGATVFVESKNVPSFNTYAVVPIDQEGSVKYDKIYTQEGQAEQAIQTGLYQMAAEKSFNRLDSYLNDFIRKNGLTGKNPEAASKLGSTGYTTPYYYVDTAGSSLQPLYDAYLKNPSITREELQALYDSSPIEPEKIFITIQLFMKEKGASPDKNAFNKLVEDIKQLSDIPKGSYGIVVNDNRVDKKTGMGIKDNSLEHLLPNLIIKE
ncbi:DUF1672 family protein [Peribacillus sp. SCS-26]|uniref:DUF1672 family protein n=1 Tax=Paraperibacillus marinus TaxID=3115295 RepID=UPI003905ACB6